MGKSKRPRVYMRARKLIDPATGQMVGAFMPAGAADASIVRGRGYKDGELLRADLFLPRHLEFHRLAHALGGLVAENIEGFEGLDHHQAIKRLQEKSGEGCEITRTEVPGFGVLEHRAPYSIAFDEMDQAEFYKLMRALCRFIASEYWPHLEPEQVEEMIELMPTEAA
ncbi:hypothetical protein [Halomonas elongata]|uniref:hypothetical protein n=1 Tax=Halomonas elongata TaxID=2746 RepID=UPI00186B91D8|nr:hypothetical protein [Halomonas elongata]MBW5800659.1 hypothetical protein [Halomonas elongata]